MKLYVTVLSLLMLVAAFCSPALSAPTKSSGWKLQGVCFQCCSRKDPMHQSCPTWTMVRQRKMPTTGKG
ncbi:CCL4L2 isoform 3 [Pongo abelii]|uniref:CCL4L2 isoform 3 n=1 Tax=Pongo abelii TaxID=9601 RepID=A0A2J8QZG9_PONAB|nr:CCL4L2 isoform 3 [Pongo abelii]